MTATQFTPLASTIGGVLIGVAATLLMLSNGRIAGISGIVGRLLPPYRNNNVIGAAAFIFGLMTAPLGYTLANLGCTVIKDDTCEGFMGEGGVHFKNRCVCSGGSSLCINER